MRLRLKDLRPCIEEIPIRSAIANNVVHGTTYENSIHKFSDLDGQKGHGVAIMVDCFVMVKEGVKNGWHVNGGEYVRYGDVRSCIDESSSITVFAINGNRIRGRVMGLVGDKATSQRIEMEEGERKRVFEILHEMMLINKSCCRLLEE